MTLTPWLQDRWSWTLLPGMRCKVYVRLGQHFISRYWCSLGPSCSVSYLTVLRLVYSNCLWFNFSSFIQCPDMIITLIILPLPFSFPLPLLCYKEIDTRTWAQWCMLSKVKLTQHVLAKLHTFCMWIIDWHCPTRYKSSGWRPRIQKGTLDFFLSINTSHAEVVNFAI